jgi:predicted aspartyl protease
MQINGEWFPGDDAIVRPVVRGQILASNDSWVRAPFLVDTGADRTVFSAAVLALLHLQSLATYERLTGLGGVANAVVIETQVRFRREARGMVTFRDQYAAVTKLEALDMSVLGRDITGLFAVIVDRPGNVVCLLRQRHHYTIEQG